MKFVKQYISWIIFVSFGIISFVLGMWGYRIYLILNGISRSWFDLVYVTFQLFILESGNLGSPLPWQFELARFLAPMVPAWAVIKTLGLLFQKQIKLIRLRFIRHHAIIIGFDAKGRYLFDEFRMKKIPAVVIINTPINTSAIDYIKSQKGIIIEGDPQNSLVLKRTFVEKAKYIISVLEDDNAQIEIAFNLWQLFKERKKHDRKKKVVCAIHFKDPNYFDLLDHHKMIANQSDTYELHIFSTFDNSIRVLMKSHPYDRTIISPDSTNFVQLILIGFGHIGERIALHAAQKCHFANEKKSKIVVFDPTSDYNKKNFLHSYPTFTQICDIEFVSIKDNVALPAKIDFYVQNKDAISTILLLWDNPVENLMQAIEINSFFNSRSSVFVRMHDESILSQALQGKNNDFFPMNIECFGLPHQTSSIELIIEEKLDQMAQAIRAFYLEKNPSGTKPKSSQAPWKQISEDYKDANRQAADHIDIKLRAINCFVTTLSTHQPAAELSTAEIEILAKMEHNRWKAERLLKGWTFAPERDDVNKKHHCIVTWEQLLETEREKDRQQVRDIPNILKKVKLKIVRSN